MKKIFALILLTLAVSLNLAAQDRQVIDAAFETAAMEFSKVCPQEVDKGIVLTGASYYDSTFFVNFFIDCQELGVEEPLSPEVDKLLRATMNNELKQAFPADQVAMMKQLGIDVGVNLYSKATNKLLGRYTFDPGE